MNAVKEKAYAKINLYLDVVGKRDDGFHCIKTVMHSLSLCDDITVIVSDSRDLSIRLQINGNKYLPTDDKNLAYRAADLFYKRLCKSAAVTIKLTKRIPVSAGLAGGSSDAAAVLRALNRMNKRPFTVKELCRIGAELGSDVPYCILGKTALCEGRGEILTRIRTNAVLNAVIAGADERVSTPMAYKALDVAYNDFKDVSLTDAEEKYRLFETNFKSDKSISKYIYNIFESVVLSECPKAKALKEELLSLGAECAMMSGSGPSVFALFDTMDDALAAESELISKGYKAWIAHSV